MSKCTSRNSCRIKEVFLWPKTWFATSSLYDHTVPLVVLILPYLNKPLPWKNPTEKALHNLIFWSESNGPLSFSACLSDDCFEKGGQSGPSVSTDISITCCFFGPVDLFAIFLDRKDPTDIAELFVNALVTERCCCHWSGVDSELFAVDMLWCFLFLAQRERERLKRKAINIHCLRFIWFIYIYVWFCFLNLSL